MLVSLSVRSKELLSTMSCSWPLQILSQYCYYVLIRARSALVPRFDIYFLLCPKTTPHLSGLRGSFDGRNIPNGRDFRHIAVQSEK